MPRPGEKGNYLENRWVTRDMLGHAKLNGKDLFLPGYHGIAPTSDTSGHRQGKKRTFSAATVHNLLAEGVPLNGPTQTKSVYLPG